MLVGGVWSRFANRRHNITNLYIDQDCLGLMIDYS